VHFLIPLADCLVRAKLSPFGSGFFDFPCGFPYMTASAIYIIRVFTWNGFLWRGGELLTPISDELVIYGRLVSVICVTD
jgi:hypothetical protein